MSCKTRLVHLPSCNAGVFQWTHLHVQQDSNPHLAVLETVIFPLNYGRILWDIGCQLFTDRGNSTNVRPDVLLQSHVENPRAVGRGIEPLNVSPSLVFETSSSSIRTPTKMFCAAFTLKIRSAKTGFQSVAQGNFPRLLPDGGKSTTSFVGAARAISYIKEHRRPSP